MEPVDLYTVIGELRDSIRELAKRFEIQEEVISELRVNRRGLYAISLAVACIGVCLVGGGYLYYQVASAQKNIQTVQDRTSTEILCPLYQTLAQAIRANPSPPGLTAEQIELRQHAAVTITNGLAKLGCV